jgi:hypothetical protein
MSQIKTILEHPVREHLAKGLLMKGLLVIVHLAALLETTKTYFPKV